MTERYELFLNKEAEAVDGTKERINDDLNKCRDLADPI
jgi:hypothetical protein